MWLDFNYIKVFASSDEQIIEAFNQAMTSPFGSGARLTWLANTTIAQKCSEIALAELERTIKHLPANSHLVFTSTTKPDGRIKSTKLLQKHAQIQEFSVIPSWNTGAITQLVKDTAADEKVELTADGIDFLVEAVGGDSRRLVMELQKLKLFSSPPLEFKPSDSKTLGAKTQPLSAKILAQLVNQSAHNSFQLATAMRLGQTNQALTLLSELLANNEAGLKILATLTSQFRTWLWIKILVEANERDDKIAAAAEISNPKRIHFLRQEVKNLESKNLIKILAVLLQLELGLKTGVNETAAMQTAIIEICLLTKNVS